MKWDQIGFCIVSGAFLGSFPLLMPAERELNMTACFVAGIFTGVEASATWIAAICFIALRVQDEEAENAGLIAVSVLASMFIATSGVQTAAPATIFYHLAGAIIATVCALFAFVSVVESSSQFSKKSE